MKSKIIILFSFFALFLFSCSNKREEKFDEKQSANAIQKTEEKNREEKKDPLSDFQTQEDPSITEREEGHFVQKLNGDDEYSDNSRYNEYFKDGIYKKSYEYKCRCESLKLMDNYFTVKTISEAEGLCSNKSLNKSLIAKPGGCIPYDSRFSDPIKADPNSPLSCYCGFHTTPMHWQWQRIKNLWKDDDRIVSGANYEEASLKCKKLNLSSPDNDRYLAKACENSN